jgi:hypothetical protein
MPAYKNEKKSRGKNRGKKAHLVRLVVFPKRLRGDRHFHCSVGLAHFLHLFFPRAKNQWVWWSAMAVGDPLGRLAKLLEKKVPRLNVRVTAL